MSQNDVLVFLKKNTGSHFSAREISKLMNIAVQTATKNLNKLAENSYVDTKTVMNRGSKAYKLYGYVNVDDTFEKTLHEYLCNRQTKRFNTTSTTTVENLMIISELKKIRGMLENGTKK